MTADVLPTAAAAGFHMPAEWEPHERCWMAWPCRLEVWGDRLAGTQQAFADVANTIADFEPVTMLALPQDIENASRLCSDKVFVLQADLDDSWTRDMGPNFVINDAGEVAASVFNFNAWGKKYEPWQKDAAIAHRIAEYLGVRTFSAPIFMEGGGINVDGRGTLLTSEQCVLHDNRNPGLTKADAEKVFHDSLGIARVLWVPGDPEDAETDGHIDGIACFTGPEKVLVEICPAEGTQRYDNMQKNVDALRGATDATGRDLEIAVIEEAYEAERPNEIFASSYVNFYIANGAVVMPRFGIDRDEDARRTIAGLFPDREVVQLEIDDIAIGGGGIHCITQQQPRAN